MTFALLRQLFKQIRILETKNKQLASMARRNIRLHINQHKANIQCPPKKKKTAQHAKDLSAFVQLLSEANRDSSHFSQNQKLKLVEISCNINRYVDNTFRLRKEILSKQMQALMQNQQFVRLPTEQDKAFVLKIVKKVFYGQQSFDYAQLSDFFSDKRFKKSSQSGQKQLKKLDEETTRHVMGILSGKQQVTPHYKTIYEHYFTEMSKQQISFNNYLNSFYILSDFDDVEEDWATNTHQKQQNETINQQRKKAQNQARIQSLKKKEKMHEQAYEDERTKGPVKIKFAKQKVNNQSYRPGKKW